MKKLKGFELLESKTLIKKIKKLDWILFLKSTPLVGLFIYLYIYKLSKLKLDDRIPRDKMRQKFLLIISSKGFEYIENSSDLSNRISYVLYKETLLFNIHYKAEADMDTFIKSIIDIYK